MNRNHIIIGLILVLGLIAISGCDKEALAGPSVGVMSGPNPFVCGSSMSVMDCSRLSSTGITCYPNMDDNKGYKRCSEGWKVYLPPPPAESVEKHGGETYTCKRPNEGGCRK